MKLINIPHLKNEIFYSFPLLISTAELFFKQHNSAINILIYTFLRKIDVLNQNVSLIFTLWLFRNKKSHSYWESEIYSLFSIIIILSLCVKIEGTNYLIDCFWRCLSKAQIFDKYTDFEKKNSFSLQFTLSIVTFEDVNKSQYSLNFYILQFKSYTPETN